ncbi:MAG: hypothetical protein WA902_20175, partial [Thermosynechococcaceae cyanobacterium]
TKNLKDKESLRWLQAQVASELDLPEGVALVTVADRESDIYELIKCQPHLAGDDNPVGGLTSNFELSFQLLFQISRTLQLCPQT